MGNFISIVDKAALDRFLADANGGPVVIMKHSSTCGISNRAYRNMDSFEGPVGLVIVQEARDVSEEVARRSGVSHETPQVLIMRDGQVLFTASHFDVKAETVAAELQKIHEGTHASGVTG